ncbi:MAG: hypothetical protein HY858_08380 [Candidatus Solibacter usitatus]|nr:hypothetical protein [Candidatus Solibacter usitatus]
MSNAPPTTLEQLRQHLLATKLKLPRLNYFASHILSIQRRERPTAKLPNAAFANWSQDRKSADWPCADFANIATALADPVYGPVSSLRNFFGEMAVVEHLFEGRDVRDELQDCFGPRLPAALVVIAADARRIGVLRHLGYRPGRNDISGDDIRYANRLLGIAREVHGEILDALATHAIAWPCNHCGNLSLNMILGFCSKRCEAKWKRRQAYLKSPSQAARRSSQL